MLAPATFHPSLSEAAHLFDLLADPSVSFLAIAARFHTSLAELSIFLTRPEIAERYSGLESNFARRTRLVATAVLPTAAASALRILNDFNESTNASPTACSRETALRAARIVLRLANFAPGPIAPRPASARVPQALVAAPLRNSESPVFPVAPAAAAPESVPAGPTLPASAAPLPMSVSSQTPSPHTRPQAHQPMLATDAQPPTPSTAESLGHDIPSADSLSDEEVLRLAEELIRKGAFSQNQIDEAFRIAAAQMHAESGDLPASSDEIEAAAFHSLQQFLAGAPP